MRGRSFSVLCLSCMLCIAGMVGCGGSESPPPAAINSDQPEAENQTPPTSGDSSQTSTGGEYQAPDLENGEEFSPYTAAPPLNPYPRVVVTTNLGKFTLKLNREKSPITVQNFLDNYVETGFYDGTVLHYVNKGKLIAGGGFTVDGTQKEVRGQIYNEATNGLKNVRGTIALARDPEFRNSGTSQFLLNLSDNPEYDHAGEENEAEYGYCVFGEVVEGMDILDKIGSVPTGDTDIFVNYPKEAIVIQSVQQID